MRTRGAVLFESPGDWQVVDIEVEDPRQGELLVRMVASGLCHSDDHYAKGDTQAPLPFAGGHEGAGIVEQVGPNTPGWSEGDHVVMSFLPACGRCRWCASGMQNLCDMGKYLRDGCRADGSFRMSLPGDPRPLAQMCGLATFSEHTLIDVAAAIHVPDDLPLVPACLAGCGVGIGWAIPPMAKAAVVAGADGVMVEVHPQPWAALSDGQQALTPEVYAQLAVEMNELAEWRSNQPSQIPAH